jgi:hypothetical protein
MMKAGLEMRGFVMVLGMEKQKVKNVNGGEARPAETSRPSLKKRIRMMVESEE